MVYAAVLAVSAEIPACVADSEPADWFSSTEEIREELRPFDATFIPVSGKTGDGVEEAFRKGKFLELCPDHSLTLPCIVVRAIRVEQTLRPRGEKIRRMRRSGILDVRTEGKRKWHNRYVAYLNSTLYVYANQRVEGHGVLQNNS